MSGQSLNQSVLNEDALICIHKRQPFADAAPKGAPAPKAALKMDNSHKLSQTFEATGEDAPKAAVKMENAHKLSQASGTTGEDAPKASLKMDNDHKLSQATGTTVLDAPTMSSPACAISDFEKSGDAKRATTTKKYDTSKSLVDDIGEIDDEDYFDIVDSAACATVQREIEELLSDLSHRVQQAKANPPKISLDGKIDETNLNEDQSNFLEWYRSMRLEVPDGMWLHDAKRDKLIEEHFADLGIDKETRLKREVERFNKQMQEFTMNMIHQYHRHPAYEPIFDCSECKEIYAVEKFEPGDPLQELANKFLKR